MRVAAFLLILYIALTGIIIFDQMAKPGWTPEPYNQTASPNQTSLWYMFIDPVSWKGNILFDLIIGSLAITGIAIGAAFLTKSDIALLSPLFIAIINLGIIPIIAIYTVVFREVFELTCSGTPLNTCNPFPALMISGLCVGGIAIWWILTCVEWWTQRPAT